MEEGGGKIRAPRAEGGGRSFSSSEIRRRGEPGCIALREGTVRGDVLALMRVHASEDQMNSYLQSCHVYI